MNLNERIYNLQSSNSIFGSYDLITNGNEKIYFKIRKNIIKHVSNYKFKYKISSATNFDNYKRKSNTIFKKNSITNKNCSYF